MRQILSVIVVLLLPFAVSVADGSARFAERLVTTGIGTLKFSSAAEAYLRQGGCKAGPAGSDAGLRRSFQSVAASNAAAEGLSWEGFVEASAWRGRRVDGTGLCLLGVRYYDPTTGRFISPDPLGLLADPALYSFAGGDPVNYFDSDGRFIKGAEATFRGSISGDDPNSVAFALGRLAAELSHRSGDGLHLYPYGSGDLSVILGPGAIFSGREVLSLGVGFVPLGGSAQSLVELASGRDYITGDPANRWLAGIGFVAGVIPGAKTIVKGGGGLVDEVAEIVAQDVKVIGRLPDTAVAKPWAGHDVLDIPNWTPAKNAQWVDQGIKNGQVFYTATPEVGNLIQTSGRFAGQPTIYAQEIQQLKAAGYVKVGDYYVPASKAATFKP